ncbi:MAG: hypothetical protein ACR2NM_09000 [Bythopirellula sp.]
MAVIHDRIPAKAGCSVDEGSPRIDVAEVALQLARSLDELKQDYAIGGAIALGYWGIPRGTIDVDLTLFLSLDHPSECLRMLQRIACDFQSPQALETLQQRGFCRVQYEGREEKFHPSKIHQAITRAADSDSLKVIIDWE